MSNLTKEERVVKNAPDLNPVIGHHLVIYKQVGEGSEFEKVVGPNERFKPEEGGWFSRGPVYFAYAVDANPNLRLEFNRHVVHHTQIKEFDLTIIVNYYVSEPERLIDHLHADPLTRLQKELGHLVGRALAAVSWDRLRGAFAEVEREVLKDDGALMNSARDFAAAMGLTVRTVELRHWLPQSELEPDLDAEKREADRLKREYEQQAAAHQKRLDAQLNELEGNIRWQREDLERERQRRQEVEDHLHTAGLEKLGLNAQLERMDAENKIHFNSIQRQLEKAGLVATAEAMNRLAQNVDSPQTFQNAFATVMDTFSSESGRRNGAGPAALPPGMSSSARGRLTAGGGGAAGLLNRVLEEIGQLSCGPEERRALLSAVLHLLSELVLGEEADDETVRRYGEKVKAQSTAMHRSLTMEQLQFLRRLQDYDSIKELLSDV